eukprot:93161_1
MEHARSSMPAEIINNRLYVFGGQDEDTDVNQIPLSSIEVCAIPVSPTNTPSKYPSKRPPASPVHNPSVSSSHPSLRAIMPSLDVSSKLTSTVDATRDVLTFQPYTSPTNMNINATHNTFDYVLLIVLILVTVLSSVAAVGLRCCCKRKTKVTELEAHQKDSIKTRPMISNVSVIPLETIEGIQKEMAYTNEGPSNTNEINTSDGNINVAMVLKGSARMTRGQIHDESINHDNMDQNVMSYTNEGPSSVNDVISDVILMNDSSPHKPRNIDQNNMKTTTDGYMSVNAEMVLQGSARMTLGQTPDETARQKENNEQLYVKYDDPGINTKGTKQAEEEEEEEKSIEDDAEELYDHEGMERVEGNTKETPLTPETAQSVHQGTHDIELTTMHQQSKQNEIGLMRNVDETNVGQDGYREVGEEHRNSTK